MTYHLLPAIQKNVRIRLLYLINGLLLLSFFSIKKENITIEQAPREYYKIPTVSHLANDLCSGTLGENIFTDGDFGSGSVTNLPSDPVGYAPGYNYQSFPPPNDGNYIITNNTSAWGSFASNWIDIGDNSSDPEGYMMVVNASFDPGVFYQETIDGLCENTVYQFSADVVNLLNTGGIKPNLDFWINGNYQFGTGDVPSNGQWNSYGFTFTTTPGQTSLTLSIRNNAPGGNGNDLALDNIAFQACGPEIDINTSAPFICNQQPITIFSSISGDQYSSPYFQWQISTDGGTTWTNMVGENNASLFIPNPEIGELYRLAVANSPANIENSKCRVVSNSSEFELAPTEFIQYDTLCEGLELTVGNSIYNTSGIYVDDLIASYGCDSTVITHLEVVPAALISADVTWGNPLCTGEETGFIIVENIQNGSGQYTLTLNDEESTTVSLGVGFYENLPPGEYSLIITDTYGCETTYDNSLFTPSPLTVDLGEDATVLLGCTYDLTPSINAPIVDHDWSSTLGMDCVGCLNTTIIPTETFTYTLTVTDANGCQAADSITINIDDTRQVFIPNAFSPDGDGYNDYFFINAGKDVEVIQSLKIFDRWGSLVFNNNAISPNDFESGWDGFANGKEANMGVYIYLAEILFIDGEVETFSGDVTLVK